jgi:hypothetical protein
MLGNLLGGFIVIVVGVNLIGPVADAVVAAQGGNVTGAASTILGLTTLFFALGVASAGISIAAIGLRQSGLVGM